MVVGLAAGLPGAVRAARSSRPHAGVGPDRRGPGWRDRPDGHVFHRGQRLPRNARRDVTGGPAGSFD
jgi:hypothetical protein